MACGAEGTSGHSGYYGRRLHHPHLPCLIPAGGLSPDRWRWVRSRLVPLQKHGMGESRFRGKIRTHDIPSPRRTIFGKELSRATLCHLISHTTMSNVKFSAAFREYFRNAAQSERCPSNARGRTRMTETHVAKIAAAIRQFQAAL
jgi:hypothetical protein